MNMKLRYRLFLRRKSVYYAFDDTTKTFTSLKTKNKAEANRLLMAMNEAGQQPAMNLSLARVYLRHSDPLVSTRTWQEVMEHIVARKKEETKHRWETAIKDENFDSTRSVSHNRRSGTTRRRCITLTPSTRKSPFRPWMIGRSSGRKTRSRSLRRRCYW